MLKDILAHAGAREVCRARGTPAEMLEARRVTGRALLALPLPAPKRTKGLTMAGMFSTRHVRPARVADLASTTGGCPQVTSRSGQNISHKYLEQVISPHATWAGYTIWRASAARVVASPPHAQARGVHAGRALLTAEGSLAPCACSAHQQHILLTDGYLLDSGRVATGRVTSAYLDGKTGGPSRA